MALHQRLFETYYSRLREDIFTFCDAMGFIPTWQQRKVLELVQRGEPRVAVKSGQGPGKTACSVIVGAWKTIRNFNSWTIVTAPTMRQCRDVWMTEFKLQLQRADPVLQRLFSVTTTRVEVAGCREWGISLVTASNEESAAGAHRENLSYIVEEASGVNRGFITTIKGTLTNPNAFLLMIGNPNTRNCAFFDCFNSQRDAWETLTLNAEETPESRWFSHERNRLLEEEFGRDSDVYRVRVLGEFPHVDPCSVISSEDVEACADTDMLEMAAIEPEVKRLALDLARFGSDESVIYRRSGRAIVEWKHFSKVDPNDVGDVAMRMQADAHWKNQDCLYVVDAGGMGQGVMRPFYRGGRRVCEFHTQGRALEYKKYKNKATEAWFHVARLAKARQMKLPKDRRLFAQLSNRQYAMDKHGLFVLETKEDYKKRIATLSEEEGSPDRADAAIMAFCPNAYAGAHADGAS